jgi:hypothetical protein
MKRSIRKPVLKDVNAISARIPCALLERVQKVRRKAERQGRTSNMSSISLAAGGVRQRGRPGAGRTVGAGG